MDDKDSLLSTQAQSYHRVHLNVADLADRPATVCYVVRFIFAPLNPSRIERCLLQLRGIGYLNLMLPIAGPVPRLLNAANCRSSSLPTQRRRP